MPGKQRCLNRRQCPPADRATQHLVLDLTFLVFFPRFEKMRSSIVTQVNGPSGHVDEAVGADLPTANDRHDESVRKGAQLLGKVEGKRWAACARPMKEAHLMVETNGLRRADALGHQQAVAESEHGVDGIPGWSPRSRREIEAARCDGLTDSTEVDSRGVAFDAPDVIRSVGVGESSDPVPDLCTASRKPITLRRVLFVPRPALDDPPAVLELRRDNGLRQEECSGVVHGYPKQRGP